MATGYPILLDLRGKTAVIVGGGGVAARKAQGLVAGGCGRIRCVAPEFHPQVPAEVERIAERFDPGHLEGADLVFAATDSPQINDAVVAEGRRRGLWVNRAEGGDENGGDFTVPAVWREGRLTVAVSAAGAPAVSAAVRDRMANGALAVYAALADATLELRPRLLCAGLAAGRRSEIFRTLACQEAAEVMGGGGAEALRRWLCGRYPELSAIMNMET